MISGDPKSENVIYNIDSRKFEHVGEPDLSVIHIHCPEDPRERDDPFGSSSYNSNGDSYLGGIDTWTGGYKPTTVVGIRNECKSLLKWPDSPSLSDTDFEHELNVIFQISDQPRSFVSRADAEANRTRLNTDFLWSAIGHKDMTQEQVEYEKHQGSGARQAYRKLWVQFNDTDTDDFSPKFPGDDPFNAHYDDERYHSSRESEKSCPHTEPWSGEVGRMVIWKAQTAPRDFMWTLHDEIEVNAKVGDVGSSDQVGKRDVKKTKARKASPPCTLVDDPLTSISVTLKRHTILISILSTSSWMETSRPSSWTRTTMEK